MTSLIPNYFPSSWRTGKVASRIAKQTVKHTICTWSVETCLTTSMTTTCKRSSRRTLLISLSTKMESLRIKALKMETIVRQSCRSCLRLTKFWRLKRITNQQAFWPGSSTPTGSLLANYLKSPQLSISGSERRNTTWRSPRSSTRSSTWPKTTNARALLTLRHSVKNRTLMSIKDKDPLTPSLSKNSLS